MSVWSSLRNPQFAILVTGQTMSRIGDNVFRVALNVWLVEKTGSAAIIATTMVFTIVPSLLFLMLGGIMADRQPRAIVIFISDLLCGVAVGAISFFASASQLQIWPILGCNLIFGFARAFFYPAYRAIIPELVSFELTNSANSVIIVSGRIAAILGPMIGTFVLSVANPSVAFLIDAISFGASSVCVLPLVSRVLAKPKNIKDKGRILCQLKQGFKVVVCSPWLFITICLFAATNVTITGPLAVGMPLLLDFKYGDHGRSLGLIYSAEAIGSICVGLILGNVKKFRHRGLIVYGTLTFTGLIIASIGMTSSLAWLIAGTLLIAANGTLCNLAWYNSLYEVVSQDKLGRVTSLDDFGSSMFLPVGYTLTALLVDHFPITSTFQVGGCTTIALVLVGLAHSKVREFD